MEGLLAKISLLLLLAVTVCLTVGMATPYWVSNSGHTGGLWQNCYYEIHTKAGSKVCNSIDSRGDTPSWLKGVRAVEIIACIGGFTGFLFLIIYNLKNDGQSNLNRIKLVMFLCFLCSVLSLIGVIIYSSKKDSVAFGRNRGYNWSFIMCTVSGCVMGLIVIPLAIEIKQARRMGTYESI